MAAPASDRTSELAPGFYWLRQRDESGWAWTVVRVYYHRKRLRVHFLATDLEKSLKQLEVADQTIGPEARLTSSRSGALVHESQA